jgi:DNA-binding transcriptional regulator YhcF (GntR family)
VSEAYTDEGGGGRAFERVASELLARIASGRYPLGMSLPRQRELAEEFGVSRDTVQRALSELKAQGWIKSLQGSGSTVIKTPQIHSPTSSERPDRMVTLRSFMDRIFDQPQVTLDVYTLTSESLATHLGVQKERIRDKEIAPESVSLRMMLPDESLPFPYWRSPGGLHDRLLRERIVNIMRRHAESVRGALTDLKSLGVSVDFDIRTVELVPAFKLYLVNKVEALHGPYNALRRSIQLDARRAVTALDVEGPGAGLTHHVEDSDPSSPGTVFVRSMQAWFDSTWVHLTRPSERPPGSEQPVGGLDEGAM